QAINGGLGGGIFNYGGRVTLTESTISGNSGRYGGAFFNASGAAVEIDGCTFSGNQGYYGVIEDFGPLTIRNSTIANNSAAYGGAVFGGSGVNVLNCTISGNSASRGGGIYTDSPVLQNTIVASNHAGDGPDIKGSANANFCLIGNTSGANISGSNNLLNVNPMLSPLGDHGGPTETITLLLGSPAIDAGDPHFTPPPSTDQRGLSRVVDGR